MSAAPINVAVHGAAGRMGRSVLEVLAEDPGARVVAAFEHAAHPALGQDISLLIGGSERRSVVLAPLDANALRGVDVVIDFSSPAGTRTLLEACTRARVAAVVGSTGLGEAGDRTLAALAEVAPVVATPNFSVGVHVLMDLAARAAQLLGPEFDLEIVEMHHKHKVDAPSGTALRLADVVAKARGIDLARSAVHGRSGQVGPRKPDEVGVLALRGGDVVGDHTLVLAGPSERLEITHRAHGRPIFARGAVRAAHWVAHKKPGRYDMSDVLGTR